MWLSSSAQEGRGHALYVTISASIWVRACISAGSVRASSCPPLPKPTPNILPWPQFYPLPRQPRDHGERSHLVMKKGMVGDTFTGKGPRWQGGCVEPPTFRNIFVLPICQSSSFPSTASAMRWHVPRRSPWWERVWDSPGPITSPKPNGDHFWSQFQQFSANEVPRALLSPCLR